MSRSIDDLATPRGRAARGSTESFRDRTDGVHQLGRDDERTNRVETFAIDPAQGGRAPRHVRRIRLLAPHLPDAPLLLAGVVTFRWGQATTCSLQRSNGGNVCAQRGHESQHLRASSRERACTEENKRVAFSFIGFHAVTTPAIE